MARKALARDTRVSERYLAQLEAAEGNASVVLCGAWRWHWDCALWLCFETHPERYRHWSLSFDGAIATLLMNVDEEGGLGKGYKLKLNSYDLGVDIELYDALQRIRFEHPEVGDEYQGPNILFGRQHFHAWTVIARLEGQLL